MKNKAFTLIELLVVVLIIGILAAIAVPQYQKAVIKSRLVQSKLMTKALAEAEEVFFLANGKYATSFDDLDISMPSDYIDRTSTDTKDLLSFSWGKCWIADDQYGSRVICSNNDNLNLYIYLKNSQVQANKKTCRAKNTDLTSIQNRICKEESDATLSHIYTSNSEGYIDYYYY